jgi:hypothetical protein
MYTLSIKYQPRYVSFSGGGAKGQCYISVAYALEKAGFIANILVYGGSSAGAMTAAILATGITAQRLEQVSDFNFTDLLDYSCMNTRGIYDGDILLNQVRQILEIEIFDRSAEALVAISKATCSEEEITLLVQRLEKINLKCITFADFNFLNKILPEKVKQLVLTGTNIDDKCLEYFSAITTPDMEVALAVRISASFPMVFKSVSYNNKNFADGGIINNLPTRALYNLSYEECDFLNIEKKKERTLLFILGQKENEIIQNLKVSKETKPGSLWGNYRYSLSYNFFNPWCNISSKIKTWIAGVDHDFHETVLYEDLANNYMKQLLILDTYGIDTLDFDKKLIPAERKAIENKLVKQFTENEYVYEFDDPVKFLLSLQAEDISRELLVDLREQSSAIEKKREGMQRLFNTIRELKANEKNNALLIINQIKAFNQQITTEEEHCFPSQETIDVLIDLSNKIKNYTRPLTALEDQKIMFGRLKIAIGDKLFLSFKNNIIILCDNNRYHKPETLEFSIWWNYSKALLFLNHFFSLISKDKEKYIDVAQKEKIIDFLKETKMESFQSLTNTQLLTETIHALYQCSDIQNITRLLETIIVGYQSINSLYKGEKATVLTLLKEVEQLEIQSDVEDCQLYSDAGYSILP